MMSEKTNQIAFRSLLFGVLLAHFCDSSLAARLPVVVTDADQTLSFAVDQTDPIVLRPDTAAACVLRIFNHRWTSHDSMTIPYSVHLHLERILRNGVTWIVDSSNSVSATAQKLRAIRFSDGTTALDRVSGIITIESSLRQKDPGAIAAFLPGVSTDDVLYIDNYASRDTTTIADHEIGFSEVDSGLPPNEQVLWQAGQMYRILEIAAHRAVSGIEALRSLPDSLAVAETIALGRRFLDPRELQRLPALPPLLPIAERISQLAPGLQVTVALAHLFIQDEAAIADRIAAAQALSQHEPWEAWLLSRFPPGEISTVVADRMARDLVAAFSHAPPALIPFKWRVWSGFLVALAKFGSESQLTHRASANAISMLASSADGLQLLQSIWGEWDAELTAGSQRTHLARALLASSIPGRVFFSHSTTAAALTGAAMQWTRAQPAASPADSMSAESEFLSEMQALILPPSDWEESFSLEPNWLVGQGDFFADLVDWALDLPPSANAAFCNALSNLHRLFAVPGTRAQFAVPPASIDTFNRIYATARVAERCAAP